MSEVGTPTTCLTHPDEPVLCGKCTSTDEVRTTTGKKAGMDEVRVEEILPATQPSSTAVGSRPRKEQWSGGDFRTSLRGRRVSIRG